MLTTVVAYTLLVVGCFMVAYGYRRRRRRVHSVNTWKPTPWDEFRSRVVQATGCQTVHEALRRGDVRQLPAGWLTFDGLKHHPDPDATLADYWQAHADAAALEPRDATVAHWLNVAFASDLPSTQAPTIPDPGFVTWDWEAGDTQAVEEAAADAEPESPWVGRMVDVDGEARQVAYVRDDGFLRVKAPWNHRQIAIDPATATLHPSDVRVGDLMRRPEYDNDPGRREEWGERVVAEVDPTGWFLYTFENHKHWADGRGTQFRPANRGAA